MHVPKSLRSDVDNILTVKGGSIMFIFSIFRKKITHLKKTWLLLIAGFCLSCLSPIASSQTIWKGESGGLLIHWTKEDITATKGGKIVFSAEDALARKDFEREFFLDSFSGGPVCEYNRTFTLLSVVGTIASMKDTFEQHCQAMTHGYSKITTINLANPDQLVSLTDYFNESVILKALLADSLIQKALAEIDTPPTTLEALYQVFGQTPDIVARSENGIDCQFQLHGDLLTQFAFHHIDKDRVAVRIALEPATQVCRDEQAQIGIYLPIPKKLNLVLKKAQKAQAGFLMGKMPKKQETAFYFSTDTYTSYQVAGTRVTTVSKARLRSSPQLTTDSMIIEILEKGTVLKMLARTPFQEDNRRYHRDYWYFVELENGKNGWIFGALTKRLKNAPLTGPRRTTDDGVRVLSAPRLKANILETFDKGITVYTFARSKRQNKIGDLLDYWYQVHLDRDKTGWIFGGQLMETETRVSMGKEIPVRSAPEQQSDVIKTFDSQHSHIYIYGRSKHQDKIGGILDYWYKVGDSRERNRGLNVAPVGWVFGGQIMKTGTQITMVSRASMRSAPSLRAKRIGRLKKGVVVNTIARSTHQDKIARNLDYWYQVRSASGKVGWVFGSLLMPIGFSKVPSYSTSEVAIVQETDEFASMQKWPDKQLNCSGTEPFWDITISEKGVRYGDVEKQVIYFPAVSLNVSSNEPEVWSIKAENKANEKSVVFFLQKDKCNDGMSDNEYKYHIFVRFHNDRVLSGCCN